MLKIYNTLLKQKVEFAPRSRTVRMFVCGPTVYDYSHIGHARTYIAFDVAAKYLRHLKYRVKFLMNITDIDDKIIDRAKKEGKTPQEVARFYEDRFYEDLDSLRIDSVDKFARATDFIPEIVKQVQTLLKKGYAYLIEGDGYYFDLSKFPEYGKLSGRTGLEAEDSVSRIDESVNKRNKGDFALWKFSKPGEPYWDTPLGRGRPGWHIEDTAITEKYFGQQYEIHCGAQDLIFPHHEAEIAQQEAASGKKPFVAYWLHSGLLTINGQKMSKSLGNFVLIRDALNGYSPEAVRMMFLMAHYHAPLDYKEENLKQAEAAVARLSEFLTRLESAKHSLPKKGDGEIEKLISETHEGFDREMSDDFNTPRAIAQIFDLIRKINPLIDLQKLSRKSGEKIAEILLKFDKVLGILPLKPAEIPEEIRKLADEREIARQQKDFDKADELRERIKAMGYEIDDTPHGHFIKKTV